MARKRKRAKRFVGSNIEPVWRPDIDTTDELMRIFNWYNYNKTTKQGEKYFEAYLKYIGEGEKTVKAFRKISLNVIPRSVFWLARLIITGVELPDDVMKHLNEAVNNCKEYVEEQEEIKEEKRNKNKKVISIQERIEKQVDGYIEEIDLKIDSFIKSSTKKSFDISTWLQIKKVKSTQSKMISDHYSNYLEELEELVSGKCEQLNEAYSFLTKPQQKKFLKFVRNIVKISDEWSEKAKRAKAASRKVRKRKPKSPLKMVEKLKYLKESDEYGLKSIPPTRIIGATELWVFNVKYRTLGVYHCPNGHGFTVKGTTIQNFDLDKSVCKKLRKPEKPLEEVATQGKVGRRKILSKLSTKEKPLTGRINGDTIILKVS